MTFAQIAGLILLGASLVLAPIVGHRLHDKPNCPVCAGHQSYRNQRRDARRRHPSTTTETGNTHV